MTLLKWLSFSATQFFFIWYFFFFSDTPRSMIWLHTINWIIGIFGAFFILLGHGHYTLDIVLAFAITSKLFSLHHFLANNISLMTRDKSRLKRCFPVLYYFERGTDGYIPNEYEWPLPRIKKMESFYHDVKYSFGNYCISKPKLDKWLDLTNVYCVFYLINTNTGVKTTVKIKTSHKKSKMAVHSRSCYLAVIVWPPFSEMTIDMCLVVLAFSVCLAVSL